MTIAVESNGLKRAREDSFVGKHGSELPMSQSYGDASEHKGLVHHASPPRKHVRFAPFEGPLSPAPEDPFAGTKDFIPLESSFETPLDRPSLNGQDQQVPLLTPVPSSALSPDHLEPEVDKCPYLNSLLPSRPITPSTRRLQRLALDNLEAFGKTEDAAVAPADVAESKPGVLSSQWVADPTKFRSGKKAKFYGVRVGRKPGIYYS